MSLVDTIRQDMFTAFKDAKTAQADILKLVLAEIKNEEISLGKELLDKEVLEVLRKQEKKIKDAISQFAKMQREDLLSKETEQLELIQKYLPPLLDEHEIEKVVSRLIVEKDVKGIQNMGLVMGAAMKELNGKADGNSVKEIVQRLLSK